MNTTPPAPHDPRRRPVLDYQRPTQADVPRVPGPPVAAFLLAFVFRSVVALVLLTAVLFAAL